MTYLFNITIKQRNLGQANKVFGLVFLICCSWLLRPTKNQAQTVLISEDINVRIDEVYQIVGQAEDYIYFFHEKANKLEIQIFDQELRYIRTNQMEMEKSRVVPFSISLIDNKISFIYFYRDRGQVVMNARQYNTQLELLQKDTIFTTDRADLMPRFFLSESEDHSKVMIYSFNKNSIISAACYDLNTFTLVWRKEIHTDGKLREDFLEAIVTNSGVGYFLSDRSPNSHRKQRLNLEAIRYSQGLQDPLSFNVEITELYSQEIKLSYDNQHGYIVASGLYTEKANSRQNGLFILRINSLNPQKRIYKKYPFDPKLENEIIAEIKDRQEGILDLKPVEIVLREDGGVMLISEIQKVHQRYGGLASAVSRNVGNRSWTDYYNEDIVMHSFFPDGTHHWNLVLHKKQYSQDDAAAYSSFFTFKNRSAVRLFFNDEISSSNTVSEYIIAGNGQSHRKSVMSTEYQKLRLRFSNAVQLDGRSFLVPSDSGNKINLVKIAY